MWKYSPHLPLLTSNPFSTALKLNATSPEANITMPPPSNAAPQGSPCSAIHNTSFSSADSDRLLSPVYKPSSPIDDVRSLDRQMWLTSWLQRLQVPPLDLKHPGLGPAYLSLLASYYMRSGLVPPLTSDLEVQPAALTVATEPVTPPAQITSEKEVMTPPKTTRKRESDNKDELTPKRLKAARKLEFDDINESPVSGTIIKVPQHTDRLEDPLPENAVQVRGDIEPSDNQVVVTPEARAELAKIRNVLGDYLCRLCHNKYDDAFALAAHRCSCIVHLEYRCPECSKVFGCPANLASHRRWHRPRLPTPLTTARTKKTQESSTAPQTHHCPTCLKTFKQKSYLKRHLLTHDKLLIPSNTLPIGKIEPQQSNTPLDLTMNKEHKNDTKLQALEASA